MDTYEMQPITRSWRGKCWCGFVTDWLNSRRFAEIDLRAHANLRHSVNPS